MKKFIPTLLLLTACVNHKAAIIEQIRSARINLQAAQDVYTYDSIPGHLKIDDKYFTRIAEDSRHLVDYKNEVDSLELELKKY